MPRRGRGGCGILPGLNLTRKFVGRAGRWVLTFGILAWLGWKMDWSGFGAIMAQADYRWLGAAVAAYGVTTLLSIWRWHLLLSACHAPMKIGRTAQLTMIGLFANAILPGAMSGDLLKGYYAVRELPAIKPAVVISILTDRLLGFVAMFAVSTALIFSRFEALTSEPATRVAVYLYFLLFGGMTMAILVGSCRPAVRWIPFLDRLPFRKTLAEAGEAYHFFLRHPVCFWGGLVLSAVAHFALMGTFYFVSLALAMGIHFLDLAAVLPLVAIVTLLPLTINGLGIREVAFKHFLVFAGMTKEASVALSLGGFFVILFWNLVGGLFYLRFRHRTHAPDLAEAEREISAGPAA